MRSLAPRSARRRCRWVIAKCFGTPPAQEPLCISPRGETDYPESDGRARAERERLEPRNMRRHVKSDNERTLTRAELRQVIYACCPSLSRQDASKLIDGFFEEVSEALAGANP